MRGVKYQHQADRTWQHAGSTLVTATGVTNVHANHPKKRQVPKCRIRYTTTAYGPHPNTGHSPGSPLARNQQHKTAHAGIQGPSGVTPLAALSTLMIAPAPAAGRRSPAELMRGVSRQQRRQPPPPRTARTHQHAHIAPTTSPRTTKCQCQLFSAQAGAEASQRRLTCRRSSPLTHQAGRSPDPLWVRASGAGQSTAAYGVTAAAGR